MKAPIALLGAVFGSALGMSETLAADPSPGPGSNDTRAVDDPRHLFTPVTQGALAAASLGLLVAGGALVSSTQADYDTALEGGGGSSCRPCSTKQLTSLEGRYYGGLAAIGLGAVIGVADIVLVVLDAKHMARPRARLSVSALEAQWQF